MNTNTLKAEGLNKSYGKKRVLHDINLEIQPGKIYGLIGRNGAGKTTLLSILTAQNTHDTGTVTYANEKVWENSNALAGLCFSRELSPVLMFGQNTLKVREYLNAASYYYPHWDKEYAERLVKIFALDKKQKIYKLSKGMLSMVTIVIALASRAPITMLDEPVAGLDVVAREQFYALLLEDYAKTQRTFIISTHIIEEAASILEDIIFIDEGKIIEHCNTEEFVSSFSYLQGNTEEVDTIAKGLNIIHTQIVGRQKMICVREDNAKLRELCDGKEISILPVSLQKIFVHLTTQGDRGIQEAI